jgi:hypothetical protein
MAGKLPPGRQSNRVNARVGVRHQVARFGGPPPGLPHTQLGGRDALSLRGLASRNTIADAGVMKAG